MIVEDSFVSISELRDKTSSVIRDLKTVGEKIVLSQNKPVGVFLSVEKYNNLKKVSFLGEKASKEDIDAYKNSSHGEDGVEAFSFLDKLK